MKAHGGSLTVEYSSGQGSVFYAHLPDIRPLILVVDDDRISLRLISSYIQNLDVNVRETGSAAEALEIMKQATPHVIITDLIMSEMDGFEFIEEVKKDSKAKEVPIIVVTSDTDMKTRDKVFQMGANDYVTKPISLEELNPRIRRFLSRNR